MVSTPAVAAPGRAPASEMTHGQVLRALCSLLLALFIASLSATVVSTALPQMLDALDGSQTQYTWVITATLLTATASMPIWGKLADLFDKKALIQAAIVVFVLGSVAAGVSQSAGQLIAARALQGVGVGGLQALVQIAIGAMISPRERGRYAGYISSATALATIGGPLLGGVVVDTSWLGWRWCFFLGIPVATAAFTLLQLTLRLPVLRRESVRIDYLGATLIAAGVSVLLVWVSFVGSSFGWGSWQTAVLVVAALGLLGGALVVESRASEPIVPLHILRQRTVALSVLGSLAAGTAMYGASVFLSQYFQVARGFSPTASGLLTIPMMAGILVASIVAGRLISRSGRIKPFILLGTVLLTLGFAVLGTIDEGTPLLLVGTAMVLVGAGVGMTLQNFILVVQNAVPQREIGAASSTVAFFRSLGGTVGVSVLGAVLARQVADRISGGLADAGLPRPAGGLSGSPADVGAGSPAARGIVEAAYGGAIGHLFLVSACLAALGILAAVLLPSATLRTSLDLPDGLAAATAAAEVADAAPGAPPGLPTAGAGPA